jgi:hypothetical protein
MTGTVIGARAATGRGNVLKLAGLVEVTGAGLAASRTAEVPT